MAKMEQQPDKKIQDRETDLETIRISVRSFVEFLLRSGDFDGRRGGWAERGAMQAGARIHRKIQKSRGSSYRAEVPLKWEHDYSNCRLLLEGRADGIFDKDGLPVIEEIKGTYGEVSTLEEPVPVHLAQARCYTFIYMNSEQCEKAGICMTYVQMETEETRQFFFEEDREELRNWFADLLDQYQRWAEFRVSWKKQRDLSIHGLPFPFSYRPGQKELVSDIYRTILRKKQVFVQAPTGVGKTISTVYPAVISMGEGLSDRIFYLTAKTVARTVAEEAFHLLAQRGLRYKCLTLTAKEKICPMEEMRCDPGYCPYASGHYDRVNDVLYDTLTRNDSLRRETVRLEAESGLVCPYELQADLTRFADAVIGDYNYVFDPTARLRHFFGEGQARTEAVFLIDEAHNLVDRGREMFSADLTREEFLSMRREIKGRKESGIGKFDRILRTCCGWFSDLRKELETPEGMVSASGVIPSLLTLTGVLEDLLQEIQEDSLREQMLAFYFRICSFLQIYELSDENYITYGYPTGKRDCYLKLFCVNPSSNLQKVLDRGRSTVFFSATLIPVRYYKDLLSGREDDYAISVPSPFPAENRRILIGRDVSTRYERRTQEEYERIASYISAAVSVREGRYMVYFPSYQMLRAVAEIYQGIKKENETLLLQDRDMCEEEKEEFLQAFLTGREGTLTGFCVMGGSFAEGIDLQGEALMGAVVVGTGIPQIGRERELLKEYYGKDGFAYAYRVPGMNRVLQAGGRVIRTAEDKGWILLLDDRFLNSDYRSCFPPSWNDRESCTLRDAGDKIREFWLTILT